MPFPVIQDGGSEQHCFIQSSYLRSILRPVTPPLWTFWLLCYKKRPANGGCPVLGMASSE